MAKFIKPKDFKEYEKLVKEWSKVKKDLNNKVIAEKLGEEEIIQQSTKKQAPLIEELKRGLQLEKEEIDNSGNKQLVKYNLPELIASQMDNKITNKEIATTIAELRDELNVNVGGLVKTLMLIEKRNKRSIGEVISLINDISKNTGKSKSEAMKDIKDNPGIIDLDDYNYQGQSGEFVSDIGNLIDEGKISNQDANQLIDKMSNEDDEKVDEIAENIQKENENEDPFKMYKSGKKERAIIKRLKNKYNAKDDKIDNTLVDLIVAGIDNIDPSSNEAFLNIIDEFYVRWMDKLQEEGYDKDDDEDDDDKNKGKEKEYKDEDELLSRKQLTKKQFLVEYFKYLNEHKLNDEIDRHMGSERIINQILKKNRAGDKLFKFDGDTIQSITNVVTSKYNELYDLGDKKKKEEENLKNEIKETFAKYTSLTNLGREEHDGSYKFSNYKDNDKNNYSIKFITGRNFNDYEVTIDKWKNYARAKTNVTSIKNITSNVKDFILYPENNIKSNKFRSLMLDLTENDIKKIKSIYKNVLGKNLENIKGKKIHILLEKEKIEGAHFDPSEGKFVSGEGVKITKPQALFKKGGQLKRNAYKIDNNGFFGDLKIDVPKLINYRKLEAYKGDGLVFEKKAPSDLVELLTKRFDPAKVYTEKAVKIFRDLVKLSGLPIHTGSGKFRLLKGLPTGSLAKGSNNIIIVDNPNKLINRLSVLIGEKESGNTAESVKNEIMEISDYLLNNNIVTPQQHKIIYENYLS